MHALVGCTHWRGARIGGVPGWQVLGWRVLALVECPVAGVLALVECPTGGGGERGGSQVEVSHRAQANADNSKRRGLASALAVSGWSQRRAARRRGAGGCQAAHPGKWIARRADNSNRAAAAARQPA